MQHQFIAKQTSIEARIDYDRIQERIKPQRYTNESRLQYHKNSAQTTIPARALETG